MVCQAASQTRFRALKHEYGIEGEPTIIIRVIACFQPLHYCQRSSKSLKIPYQGAITSTGAHRSWPNPQHVAWPSPCLNCSCTLAEPSSQVHSAYMNPSTCIFPAVSVFPGFTAPAIPNLKTEQTNEVQGFLQYPNSERFLKETHTGGTMQNANHASLQKKLLIFDHSGSKTRLLYSPVFPCVQSPIVTAATQFAHVYDVNKESQATNMGPKHLPIYTSPEETGTKDHIDNEESEMHEDTEEINALLYSDDDGDDDDEVRSTGHSPLATERTYVMQEQYVDMKEEVASSDWPNKRQKLIDGGYNRLPPLVDSASSERLNETCECVSDAESKYSSSGRVYAGRQTKEDNSTAADIQLKKDKIRELLRVLENFIPGAKGKHPLLVIDGTIEYLKSLMS
ncbi:Transcription factor SAC51 [Mucuna pruriens]|uniref:Transcription factor SAC51 n=1 Tax=Mucuna pruriens TaxID=157652 RepID=A0A371EJS6_MUCPR|nr:Transcription factor SAC51 [Mucuna pruriens]